MRISDWSSDVCSSDLLDDDRPRALVAALDEEVGVGRSCLGNVGAPDEQKGRVVPIGALRDVGLLAPGLRARGGKVAVPVVEADAGAADQREVAGDRKSTRLNSSH